MVLVTSFESLNHVTPDDVPYLPAFTLTEPFWLSPFVGIYVTRSRKSPNGYRKLMGSSVASQAPKSMASFQLPPSFHPA